MNNWAVTFLGIIAVATLATAIVQIGVLLAVTRLVRRLGGLLERAEQELHPSFSHVNAIARDASRAAALATAQVERADHLFADVSQKVGEAVGAVHATILTPAREGMALMEALRAILDSFRDARRNSRARQRAEDEDALFI